jgi:hypothetical protein
MKKILFFLILCFFYQECFSQKREWFLLARHNASTFILDQVQQNAVGAFSMRKLRLSYTGACIRVRRSSDNAESDIGFNDEGNLNTTALTTFVGSGSAFIVTWYDQSGTFSNVSQSTAAHQPRIVLNGTVDLLGSRPSPRGDGTDFLQGPNIYTSSAAELQVYSVINVYSINNAGSGNNLFSLSDSPRLGINMPWSDGNIYWDVGGFSSPNRLTVSGQISPNTTYQFTLTNSVASSVQSVRKNRSVVGSDATGHSVTTSFTRISNPSPAGMQGFYPELIFFDKALSSNQQALIERNQGSYYGITVN